MKRKPDESYEDYKLRRDREDAQTKKKLQGRMFWPASFGTYRRKDFESAKGQTSVPKSR